MNTDDGAVFMHPLIMWSLVIVSILLVAVITYVYTNRNRKITAYFTVGSVFFLVFTKIVSIVDVKIDYYFLDKMQAAGEHPVHVAGPGWDLLWHGWFIWLLPAIISALLVMFGFIIFLKRKKVPLLSSPIEVLSTKSLASGQNDSSQTRAERLNVFMALDAAKQQVKVTQQKLTESLLINTSNEIQLSDLKSQIATLETELAGLHERVASAGNIEKIEKELQQKNTELSQCKHDLGEAQDLLKKLAGISGSE